MTWDQLWQGIKPIVDVWGSWPIELIVNHPALIIALYVVGTATLWAWTYYFQEGSNEVGGYIALMMWPAFALLMYYLLPFELLAVLIYVLNRFAIGPLVRIAFARTVDQNPMGRLKSVPYPQGRRRVYLEVEDHQGKHDIPVHPDCETVAEALAWSFDLGEESEYHPAVEV